MVLAKVDEKLLLPLESALNENLSCMCQTRIVTGIMSASANIRTTARAIHPLMERFGFHFAHGHFSLRSGLPK